MGSWPTAYISPNLPGGTSCGLLWETAVALFLVPHPFATYRAGMSLPTARTNLAHHDLIATCPSGVIGYLLSLRDQTPPLRHGLPPKRRSRRSGRYAFGLIRYLARCALRPYPTGGRHARHTATVRERRATFRNGRCSYLGGLSRVGHHRNSSRSQAFESFQSSRVGKIFMTSSHSG